VKNYLNRGNDIIRKDLISAMIH